MPIRNDSARVSQAFTLVELILVMALLATLLAVSAPLLSRSFKLRALEQEATQLLAATEYARDEAVSQGVPMSVWIDIANGACGVTTQSGYEGNPSRERTWFLPADVHFESIAAPTDPSGRAIAAQFDPDGSLDLESVGSISLVARNDESITLTQTEDGWGYEIVKEAQP